MSSASQGASPNTLPRSGQVERVREDHPILPKVKAYRDLEHITIYNSVADVVYVHLNPTHQIENAWHLDVNFNAGPVGVGLGVQRTRTPLALPEIHGVLRTGSPLPIRVASKKHTAVTGANASPPVNPIYGSAVLRPGAKVWMRGEDTLVAEFENPRPPGWLRRILGLT